MSKEYGVTCILEGTVTGDNVKDVRRIVEDALFEAFDSKAAKDSNPLMHRVKIIVAGNSVVHGD